jgi:sulfite exporter TauE/SafE
MFTYGVLGAIFGLIGISFAWFGLQQWLSILLGIIILLFVFLPKINGLKSNHLSSFFAIVRNRLGNLFTHKKFHSLFYIGLLNGLLPCGLIYTALAAAVSTGSVVESSLFMMYFALGTLPVMWSMAFFGGFINIKMRQGIKKCYPYFMAAMAILLIIRGSGLDIPYISPILHQHGHGHSLIECH